MTVSTTINTAVFTGNGVADEFSYTFYVEDEDHLVVQRRVIATGVVDKNYTSSEYVVSGVGTNNGSVTLNAGALASIYELVVQRIVPYTQNLDIVNQGGFYPETVEAQLDLTEMQIQQIADAVGRSLTVPVGEDGHVIAGRDELVGKFLVGDADGDLVPSSGTGADLGLREDLAGDGEPLLGLPEGGTLEDVRVWVTPEQFGDVGTPATCHVTLQACFDYAAANGMGVRLKDRRYTTRYPVYLVTNLTVVGSGALSEIYNELTVAEESDTTTRSAIIGGEVHPAYKASNTNDGKTVYFTMRAGEGITAGSRVVQLASGLAANFSVGNIVGFRTRAYVRGNAATEQPHFAYDSYVTAVDTGTDQVTLAHSSKRTISFTDGLTITGAADNGSGKVRLTITGHGLTAANQNHPVTVSGVTGTTEANGTHRWDYVDANTIDLTHVAFVNAYTSGGTAEHGGSYLYNYSTAAVAGLLGDAGRFVCPLRNVRLTGLKVGAASAPAFIRMGCIDSTIDVEVTSATAMCGMNAMTNCDVTVSGVCTDEVMELASNCYNSRWKIKGRVNWTTGTANLAKIGEQSSYNEIDLWLEGNYAATSNYGLYVPDSVGNVIRVHGFNLPQMVGSAIGFNSASVTGSSDNGETQPYNDDNTVILDCDAICGASVGFFIRMENAGSGLRRPKVLGGQFFGTPGTAAYKQGGTDPEIDCWFEGGNINTAAGTGGRITLRGAPSLSSYNSSTVRSFTHNGVEQHAGGTTTVISASTHQIDASIQTQTLQFSSALQLTNLTNSVIGSTIKVTLTNTSAGAITPTANSNWRLGPYFWPSLAAGESVTFVVKRVPDASGSSYAVISMANPGDGALIAPTRAAAPTVTYSLSYAAPSGGATQDAEARASLAQAAADLAEVAADLADLRTKLATAGVTL